MKNFPTIASLLSVAAFAVATPSYAQNAPEGPRAEAIVGWDNFDGQSSLNSDGVTYGVGVGYDFSIASNSSLGIDAEVTDSDVKKNSPLGGNENLHMSAKRDLYVGARYTYAATDKVNLFATVGYSNQRVSGATSLGDHDSTNLDGVRVGAGVQYDFTDKIYWTTSYRYTNYEAGLERHQAMTGLGFRF